MLQDVSHLTCVLHISVMKFHSQPICSATQSTLSPPWHSLTWSFYMISVGFNLLIILCMGVCLSVCLSFTRYIFRNINFISWNTLGSSFGAICITISLGHPPCFIKNPIFNESNQNSRRKPVRDNFPLHGRLTCSFGCVLFREEKSLRCKVLSIIGGISTKTIDSRLTLIGILVWRQWVGWAPETLSSLLWIWELSSEWVRKRWKNEQICRCQSFTLERRRYGIELGSVFYLKNTDVK